MMRSLNSGLSGVKSHQSKMDVVGNNVANVNTVGFKSSRATFADILSQNIKGATASKGTIGSTNPNQIGLGSIVSSIDLMFKNGAAMTTGKSTDLCLSGDGLFVVRRGDEIYYTRNGAFNFDEAGNYVLPGSGHFVQGWMANDGVIDTTGAAGNLNVAMGQSMPAKATNLINYFDNLDANVPTVTEISGGVDAVSQVILTSDVSGADPLPVTIGGKVFYYTGLSDEMYRTKNWVVKEDVSLGATTMELMNEDGDVITAEISGGATFEVLKGENIKVPSGILTKGSVTEEYPLEVSIDGKQYTAIGMSKNYDYSKDWTVKSGGASAGSNTITITDGSEDLTFTLNSPLEESLGQEQIVVETRSTIASEDSPVTITLSDGTSIVKTDGSYKIGNSMPIPTTVTVYDSLGATHEVPVYFIHEGVLSDGASPSKWLVSLSPDSSVIKGQTTTSEFIDAKGNKATVSLNVAEIQFDSTGNLITDSEEADASDTMGTMTLSFSSTSQESPADQSVTIDFTDLTQYGSGTTVNSSGNGNTAGTLSDIYVDSAGRIIGTYTNGVRRPEAQVAVAHFTNSPGLLKTGSNLYQESDNSGTPFINKAENFGVVITPGALEMSTVDIANEFSEMIITQRGFQSNAKVITVGDQMIETAVNLKR